jgi:PAS domain S-box-containing protein
MKDRAHIQSELLRELESLRQQVSELKNLEQQHALAEAALRESEERYKGLIDSAFDGVVLHQDGVIRTANRAYAAMFGYELNEIVGKSVVDFIAHEERERVSSHITAGVESPVETFGLRKDGSRIHIEACAKNCLYKGRPARLAAIRDITERSRREAENKRLVYALKSVTESVIITDMQNNILFVNDAFLKTYGFEESELLGNNVNIVRSANNPAELVSQILPRTLEGGWQGDLLNRRKDGTDFPIHLSTSVIRDEQGEPMALIGVAVDITERRRAEEALQKAYDAMELRVEERTADLARTNEQLKQEIAERKKAEEERRQLEAKVQQAQKLESLGVMAGGIAHDFNNLLVGILSSAGLALMKLPPDSPARRSIERVEKAGLRAAELAHQMLAYSGKGKVNVQAVELSREVEEMAHLLHTAISKKAVVQFEFAPNLPAIEADATQIRQVIMNLITNASEALGQKHGVILLSTGVVAATPEYLAESYFADDLPEGRYVYLEVTDTGCGMDVETQEKIFDPFFTTKFTGRGLGLAVVLGIVRGHHGTVIIDSHPGHGTTFRVLFPAGSRTGQAKPFRHEESGEWQGSGTILVVDDEKDVRETTRDILDEFGFSVMLASEGEEGVAILQEHAEEIVAVLLDVTMPQMDGEEALTEILRLRPDMPVILFSGYAEEEVARKFTGRGVAGFIHKPFTPTALVEKIRQVLAKH